MPWIPVVLPQSTPRAYIGGDCVFMNRTETLTTKLNIIKQHLCIIQKLGDCVSELFVFAPPFQFFHRLTNWSVHESINIKCLPSATSVSISTSQGDEDVDMVRFFITFWYNILGCGRNALHDGLRSAVLAEGSAAFRENLRFPQ